jgi:hypothetical protein
MDRTSITSVDVEIEVPAALGYAAGDVVGGRQKAGPVVGYPGLILTGAEIIDEEGVNKSLDLHIFDEQPAAISDNEPFVLSYGEARKRVAKVSVPASGYDASCNAAYVGELAAAVPATEF